MDSYIDQFKLLNAHKIVNLPQLHTYRNSIRVKIRALSKGRDKLRNKREISRDYEVKSALSGEISILTAQIKSFRKELKLCQEIKERSTMLPERLAEIRQAEQEK